jgi:hypothetical protein
MGAVAIGSIAAPAIAAVILTPRGTRPVRSRRRGLNAAGHRSGEGKPFTNRIVLHLRRDHQLPSHHERLRIRGLLTIREIADHLGVHPTTIKAWHRAGLLASAMANDKNERLYQPPTPGDSRLMKQQGRPLYEREPVESTPGGAV